MKKIYTICSIGLISASIFAQVSNQNLMKGAIFGAPQLAEVKHSNLDVQTNTNSINAHKKNVVTNRGANQAAFIEIGSTYYDLQSNNSMPRRILLHSDGAVSTTWTTASSDAAGFPGRGSGYNFRTTAGNWNASTNDKVEATQRTGWPCIGQLRNGGMFIIGHDATNGGFFLTKSNNQNEKPSITTNILTETPFKPIWARAANSGDTIHLICSYTDSAAPGEKRAPTRKGIFAPMVYSRSVDAGENWDIQHIMLPNYDSTITDNGGADQYSIDVRGDVVAIANADRFHGVILWKSLDGGASWTRKLIDSFPYMPYTGKQYMTDTPFTNDGTVEVIIDPSGKVHAFWGLGRVLDDDTSDASYSFFPGYQGLMYWNEDKFDGATIIASGGAFDRTGDGINELRQATAQALNQGALPSGVSTCARLGNTSALRQPSASIDANGNIYCTFSVPIESDISDLDANFRDIGIVHSTDGGLSWATAQNITQVLNKEDDYAALSRDANDFLHVMWQQDEIPGTNLQNNDRLMANHDVVLNKIMYQAIPVSQVLDGSIGMQFGVNTEIPNTGELFVVSQNAPNPFDESSKVIIYLTTPGDVKLEITNMMGSVVVSQKYNDLLRGNHELIISAAGLPSGVYNYTITASGNSVSKTMMVK